MNPKLTDEAVAGLPLHAGRAELLEEIMRTPVLDHAVTVRPRRNRWLVPLAVAATVAAVATAPVWWGSSDAGPTAGAPAVQDNGPAPGYVVLLAPGWQVDNVEADATGGSISYRNGRARFEVTRYPAQSYAGYVEDREHIVDPAAPGEPVEVLGKAGQLWAYTPDDHTVIREVEGGQWQEIRAAGPDRTAFLELLGQLRLVDRDAFEAALPAEYVTAVERPAEIEAMLDGIATVADPLLPGGATPELDSDQPDPYVLGAEVAGTVACAWMDEYVEARAAGDDARADEAVRVLGTSRQWPVLLEMDAEGDYSEVVWQYADEIAAGRGYLRYQDGLGC